MKSIIVSVFGLLLNPYLMHAQVCWVPVGAESWGTGGQSVTSISVFGVQNNPASIALINNFKIGLYQEIRYRQAALTLSALSVIKPGKFVNTGFGLVQQGTGNFNQQKINISIAKVLNPQVSMGINFTFLGTHIAEQEYKGNFLAEMGLIFKPNKALIFGCYVFNPTQVKFKQSIPEPIPAFVRIGFCYMFSAQLKFLGEFEHRIIFGNIPKFGFEYTPVPAFTFYTGWAQNPQLICFGSGFNYKKTRWSITASRHEVLGITPHFSLVFNMDKKLKR
ncbi:MAG: hypothetical protein Q8M15_13020 [Bacteroidota bacterium]|nr:hypothetical protein [Bacteroidota bacterium]